MDLTKAGSVWAIAALAVFGSIGELIQEIRIAKRLVTGGYVRVEHTPMS